MAREMVDDRKVMEVYNTSGGKVAREFINTEYNIAYPGCVISRLRKNPANGYDKIKDKFLCMEQTPFLELDELCTASGNTQHISGNKPICNGGSINALNLDAAFNHILQELAIEKLFEMMKYISLNNLTGKCRINKKALDSAGYQVEIY